MISTKEITCPLCKKSHNINYPFQHDKNHNLVCASCNGVMFALTEEEEKKLKSLHVNTYTGTGYNYKKDPIPIKQNAIIEPDLTPALSKYDEVNYM